MPMPPKRIQLIMFIRVDGKDASEAARTLHMCRSWGPKWYKRYISGGVDALKGMPKSGRIPRVPRKFMKRVGRMAHKAQKCWTAEEMRDFIIKVAGCIFELSYIRKLMKRWGYTMKVPVLVHVNRASRRRINRFQKRIKKTTAKAKGRGLYRRRAGRSNRYCRCPSQKGGLHVWESLCRLHIYRRPRQDRRLWIHHRTRWGIF